VSDDFGRLFDGIDAPRPLPPRVRAAVTARLTQDALVGDLGAADAPRDMPAAMRDRLEDALVAGVGARPLPVPLRRRLQRALRDDPKRRGRVAVLVAAALIVLAGSVAVLTGDPDTTGDVQSNLATGGAQTNDSSDGLTDASGALSADGSNAVAGSGTATAGGGGTGASGSASRTAAGPPAVDVRLVGGDTDAEAAFRAYAASHGFRITEAAAAPVTVNLSPQPIAPPKDTVLLESLAVAEAALTGDVFAAGSVAERQAHIAADAAFPEATSGKRAVIVSGGAEPFTSRVPDALESVLRARGVAVLRVGFDDAVPAVLPRADAAFVSLPTDLAREWLRDARGRSYAPSRGTWGVYSLADDALVAHMSSSVRVVSPFRLADAGEAEALRTALGRPLSARAVHGWVTAKLVAAAVARSGATSGKALSQAIEALRGYDDGFAAPYDLRPSTHSRTPEGIVLRPSGGQLVAEGSFLKDSR
jgi:hypothetical protein